MYAIRSYYEAEGPRAYQVGEIAYWPPRHSFVIFYAQDGEIIDDLQPVGRMTSGIEILREAGDVAIKFVITSYSIHYTKLYELPTGGWCGSTPIAISRSAPPPW